MKRNFILTILFVVAYGFSIAAALPVVGLKTDTKEVWLDKGMFGIFEDPSAQVSFEKVSSSAYQDSFRLSNEDYHFNEHESSAYWLKFVIDGRQVSGQKYVLEGMAQQSQFVEAFIPDASGKYHHFKAGAGWNFPERWYQTKNLVFDLPSDLHQPYTVYVKVKADNHAGFLYVIRSQRYFTHYNVSEYFLSGIYYGILLIMAVYNLLLFIIIRERVYFYYVLYVLSCVLLSSSEDGLGFQYLWTHSPSWNIPIDYYIAPIFFLLSFIAYSISFLQLRKKYSKLFNILLITTGVYLLYFILQVSFSKVVPYIPGLYTTPFITAYLITAYIVYKGDYKPARYFITGYTFILISIILIQLRNMQLIPSNLITINSFNFGILFEVVSLSIALGDRFRILKQENEKAQAEIIGELREKENYKNALIAQLHKNDALKDSVNRELEQKVAARTRDLAQKSEELVESNQKLQAAMEQLSKMNTDLDMDNWGLKKKVNEETRLRILAEEVSYEEFQKIYPDDTSCFRYLEEIKWGNGYHCRKCGHDKYSDPKHYVRKCTKCGHIESVTASTLFHSIKFPINKAFYIVYLTTNKKDKMTLDELSEILSLRKNTCWAFRKKVVERKEKVEASRAKGSMKWENLFLDQ